MVNSIEQTDVKPWADRCIEDLSWPKHGPENKQIDVQIDESLKRNLSKQGGPGGGRPDHTILIGDGAVTIPVLIEYKGTKGKLVKFDKLGLVRLRDEAGLYSFSKTIAQYAVNGAAYYASNVARDTNYKTVLAIGVNGFKNSADSVDYEISAYVLTSGNPELAFPLGNFTDWSFLEKENFTRLYQQIQDSQDDAETVSKRKIVSESMLDKALQSINQFLHDEHGIIPSQRINLVAACVMASLGVKEAAEYSVSPLDPQSLKGSSEQGETDGNKVYSKVQNFLTERKPKLPNPKREQILNELASTLLHSNLSKKDRNKNVSPIAQAYQMVWDKLKPLYDTTTSLDFTGRLFNIMNSWIDVPDGGANDVVLTPRYITDLMAKLVDIDMDSFVWDWALGSAGFLISAMNMMVADARERLQNSPIDLVAKEREIKTRQLLGIEKLPSVYILAALNMILMGDGSSNILNGDSLTDYHGKYVYDDSQTYPANILLLNPPYSAEGNGLIFVQRALDEMASGKGAVIIQDSAGSGRAKEIAKNILNHNRLIASIKMPGDLFKTNVQTSIYVFDVHRAHKLDDKVKFIDFRTDGYTRSNRKKSANNLRNTDHAQERYAELAALVNDREPSTHYYRIGVNYFVDTVDPKSGADWNYDQHKRIDPTPTVDDFRGTIADFLSWKVGELLKNPTQNGLPVVNGQALSDELDKLEEMFNITWKDEPIGRHFRVSGNPQLNKDSFNFGEGSEYPYFTRSVLNNGIAGYVDYLDEEHKITGNSIAVGMMGMRFFYMEKDFYAGQFTKTVYPLFDELNRTTAQYFIGLFNKHSEIYRGSLVRDFERLFKTSLIRLPFTSGKINFEYIEKYVQTIEAERVQTIEAYLKVIRHS